MVNVLLKSMRAKGLPFNFTYRHVAYRLLVDDSAAREPFKGIFFLRSYTDRPWIARIGSVLTNYRLQKANMTKSEKEFHLTSQNGDTISYWSYPDVPALGDPELLTAVGRIDRAYSIIGNKPHVTRIQRDEWPLEWLSCGGLKLSLFPSAELMGGFQIKKPIQYTWLAPKKSGSIVSRKILRLFRPFSVYITKRDILKPITDGKASIYIERRRLFLSGVHLYKLQLRR